MFKSEKPKPFVVLEGLIGVGKSKLAKALASRLGIEFYPEPVSENPYLTQFYQNMDSCSFAMQIWLMTQRYNQQSKIGALQNGGIQDRSIYGDSAFAKILKEDGHMTELELETYYDLLTTMTRSLIRPDIVVFLKAKPETCLERIRIRGREAEVGISLEYLQKLEKAYGEIMEIMPNVIIVDWEEYGSVESMADAIVETIAKRREPSFVSVTPQTN